MGTHRLTPAARACRARPRSAHARQLPPSTSRLPSCGSPLPPLQGRLDDTAAALASAFAALAARIRGTLHSCCLQRHACEERLFCCRPPRPPLAASKLGLGEALDAAAASFRQLEAAHEAARGQLSPNEADLAVLALCACMVLLQQARAAAAVLDAATPVAAPPEQCEEVQRGLEETAGGAGELQDKV